MGKIKNAINLLLYTLTGTFFLTFSNQNRCTNLKTKIIIYPPGWQILTSLKNKPSANTIKTNFLNNFLSKSGANIGGASKVKSFLPFFKYQKSTLIVFIYGLNVTYEMLLEHLGEKTSKFFLARPSFDVL